MFRWVFRVVSDLSALICMAGVIFCVRGYFVSDLADWRDQWQLSAPAGQTEYHYRQTLLWSSRGEFRFNTQHSYAIAPPRKLVEQGPGAQLFLRSASPPRRDTPSKGSRTWFEFAGFRVAELTQAWVGGGKVHVIGVAVPCWGVVVIFGFMPVLRIMMALRRKKEVGGNLCGNCGYDLRATTERCPECGMAAGTSSTA